MRTTLLRLFALTIYAATVRGQVITTVAGTDWTFPRSAVSALNAPLGNVSRVAVDTSGNVYIADPNNNLVMRVSLGGVLTVIAGNGAAGFSGDGGPATSAALSWPQAIALDSSGNLYIADTFNERVRKVSANGTITTVAGTGRVGFSGDGGPATSAILHGPADVAVDAFANLYIADSDNNRIRRVSSNGIITTFAGRGTAGFSGDGGPAANAELSYPNGLVCDAGGNLYISDFQNMRVRKVATDGTIATAAGNPGQPRGDGGPATSASIGFPYGLAVDATGNLFITNSATVRRVTPGGVITTVAGSESNPGFAGDGGLATKAALNPSGVAADSAGNLYIADSINERVRKVDSRGIISTFAGNGGYRFWGDGGLGTAAALNGAEGVAVDHSGSVYIADSGNRRVRKLAPNGTIQTIAGDGVAYVPTDGAPATSTSLDLPSEVALDPAGNLYIGENFFVYKVGLDGLIHYFAGNPFAAGGFSGDGGPATKAQFGGVGGIAADGNGNVYIADPSNNRVRKVSSSGTITTVAGNGTAGFSGDGGPAPGAGLNFPVSIALDASGSLYIADSNNYRIRKVSSAGTITTVAGNGILGYSGDGGSATGARLGDIRGLATDSAGNIYIADVRYDIIRKVSGGAITTIAGNGTAGFSGDGGLATSASLDFVGFVAVGLAVDSTGNVLIADNENNRVRKVLAGVVSYQASAQSLTFSALAGTLPSSQTVVLSSTVSGLAFTVGSSAPWLSASPPTGSIPAVIQVNVDPSGLASGAYQGTITITVPNAVPATTTVAVTLTVQPGTPAKLAVDSQSVSFTATQSSGALTQQLHVSDSGGGSLSFTANATTASGGSWLSISPANGTATPSSPAALTVTATPGSLAPGTYSGTVTITGAGSSINIPVTLSVSAPTAIILVSQSALSFTAVAQGGVPLSQNFGILNIGQGSMGWTGTATTLFGGNWLQISPSNGTVQRPYLDVSLVTVSIDPSALGAGTYYGRIQVSATAANTPQVMTVILTVLPAGLSLGPQLFPTGLIFTGVAGVTPGSQDVQVGNPTAQVNNFQSGLIGTGFSFLPTNASVQPNQPTTVRVYPDFSTLTSGSLQRGTITLQFSDGSPSQTINVLIVVAPSGVNPNSMDAELEEEAGSPAASGCAAQAWSVQFRSLQPNFTAVLGQATAVDVQIADGCGNLVGPGGQGAYAAASVTGGDPLIPMTHIGGGIWQGTWKPVSATGSVTLFVTAVGPNGVGGQNRLSGVVSAPSPAAVTPTVTAQGVVHAASDQGGVPIAPGGLITVYGVNLSDGVGQNNGMPLPQQLNGTQVLLGNQPLPILYTSSGQLNVQVPYGVPVNTQYQLTVQHGNALSVPQSLVVAAGLPGIFTVNQQGTGQGAIMKSDGVTLAQPGTPASIGETVVIYCTGLGAVSPAVKEGLPAPATPPLSTTVNPVTVTIGGTAAQVAFSGLTPGYAGLYQVNAVVPSGITTGDAVPVVVSVAGQTGPPVAMAVK